MTTTSVDHVAAHARRAAVTAQRETEIGTELLALCQPVTTDGSLSDDEALALRAWLDAQRLETTSTFAPLLPVVESCIAARRVTRAACATLFTALSALLPTDVRVIARSARRTLEEKDAERYKLERDASWQTVRDERVRNRAIARLEFMVAGTRQEGRASIIERFARAGDPAFLVRDIANTCSRHAIEVRIAGGMQLGFVPEEIASDIARLLDSGCPCEAEIAHVLPGTRQPVPVLAIALYRADSTVVDMVQPDAPLRRSDSLPVPQAPAPVEASGGFWKLLLVVVLGFALYKLLR